MKEIAVQLIMAFLGALGFSLLFRLHKKHLLLASLGGMLTWGVYLLTYHFLQSAFFANLIASVFAVFLAEVLAHWRKCPATLFVIPSIIPLVPGSTLYYAMSYAVQNNSEMASDYGRHLLTVALAIAAGISFVTICRKLHAVGK